MDISREQAIELLNNAPPDIPRDEIMISLSTKGYTIAGKPIIGDFTSKSSGKENEFGLKGQPEINPYNIISQSFKKSAQGYGEIADIIKGQGGMMREAASLPFRGIQKAEDIGSNIIPSTQGQLEAAAAAGPAVEYLGGPVSKIAAAAGPVMESAVKIPAVAAAAEKIPQLVESYVKSPLRYAARSIGSKVAVLSGLEGDMIGEVASNGKIAKTANRMFSSSVRGIFDKMSNDDLLEGINSSVSKAGKRIGDFEDEFASRPHPEYDPENPDVPLYKNQAPSINVSGIKRTILDMMSEKGISTSEIGAQGEHIGVPAAKAQWINEKLNDLGEHNQNFPNLLALKRRIGEQIRDWNKMGNHGDAFNSILRRFYGEINDALTRSIPEAYKSLHPETGRLVSTRGLWKELNKRFSDAVNAEGSIYVQMAKKEASKTSSAVIGALRSGKWKNISDAAKVIGPEAESAVENAKNIALSADIAVPGGSHHGALMSYLATTGALSAMIYGHETGNRGLEGGGLALIALTSPLAIANLARTPEAAAAVAKYVASHPTVRGIAASNIVKYISYLREKTKENRYSQASR